MFNFIYTSNIKIQQQCQKQQQKGEVYFIEINKLNNMAII